MAIELGRVHEQRALLRLRRAAVRWATGEFTATADKALAALKRAADAYYAELSDKDRKRLNKYLCVSAHK
jgi:hypothetical protein